MYDIENNTHQQGREPDIRMKGDIDFGERNIFET